MNKLKLSVVALAMAVPLAAGAADYRALGHSSDIRALAPANTYSSTTGVADSKVKNTHIGAGIEALNLPDFDSSRCLSSQGTDPETDMGEISNLNNCGDDQSDRQWTVRVGGLLKHANHAVAKVVFDSTHDLSNSGIKLYGYFGDKEVGNVTCNFGATANETRCADDTEGSSDAMHFNLNATGWSQRIDQLRLSCEGGDCSSGPVGVASFKLCVDETDDSNSDGFRTKIPGTYSEANATGQTCTSTSWLKDN